jgi:hypothetical protein
MPDSTNMMMVAGILMLYCAWIQPPAIVAPQPQQHEQQPQQQRSARTPRRVGQSQRRRARACYGP